MPREDVHRRAEAARSDVVEPQRGEEENLPRVELPLHAAAVRQQEPAKEGGEGGESDEPPRRLSSSNVKRAKRNSRASRVSSGARWQRCAETSGVAASRLGHRSASASGGASMSGTRLDDPCGESRAAASVGVKC